MRFIVEVRIEDGDHPVPQPMTVGVIERSTDLTPDSGLGLLLQETKNLLQELQTVVAGGSVKMPARGGTRAPGSATRPPSPLPWASAREAPRAGARSARGGDRLMAKAAGGRSQPNHCLATTFRPSTTLTTATAALSP